MAAWHGQTRGEGLCGNLDKRGGATWQEGRSYMVWSDKRGGAAWYGQTKGSVHGM